MRLLSLDDMVYKTTTLQKVEKGGAYDGVANKYMCFLSYFELPI